MLPGQRSCATRAGVSFPVSVLIPSDSSRAAVALRSAQAIAHEVVQVVLAGDGEAEAEGVEIVPGPVSDAISRLTSECTVLIEPGATIGAAELDALCAPIRAGQADFVVPSSQMGREDRALNALTRGIAGVKVQNPLAPVRAVRTEAIRSLTLSGGPGLAAELVIKLAAQAFRFGEVLVGPLRSQRGPGDWVVLARTLLKYALWQNDTDNTHEGYNTLVQMDQAPRYNAWLGRRLRPHLGRRVLEIGAGIGTITREIAPGRERVIALEADSFYVQRLRNLFRESDVVQPVHAPVERTDWAALAKEHLDTVMLSNVLEHIEDDAAAVRRFRSVLPVDGRLVILVPALMSLYGGIDEAIGHFRRYTPATLRDVIESNGFRIESVEWLNLLGIPGWFLNSRVLKRRSVPGLQVRLYDRIAPLLARMESMVKLPVGMSLLAVARAVPVSGAAQ
jgi:SAM-dependent methyltransferase